MLRAVAAAAAATAAARRWDDLPGLRVFGPQHQQHFIFSKKQPKQNKRGAIFYRREAIKWRAQRR